MRARVRAFFNCDALKASELAATADSRAQKENRPVVYRFAARESVFLESGEKVQRTRERRDAIAERKSMSSLKPVGVHNAPTRLIDLTEIRARAHARIILPHKHTCAHIRTHACNTGT